MPSFLYRGPFPVRRHGPRLCVRTVDHLAHARRPWGRCRARDGLSWRCCVIGTTKRENESAWACPRTAAVLRSSSFMDTSQIFWLFGSNFSLTVGLARVPCRCALHGGVPRLLHPAHTIGRVCCFLLRRTSNLIHLLQCGPPLAQTQTLGIGCRRMISRQHASATPKILTRRRGAAEVRGRERHLRCYAQSTEFLGAQMRARI